MSDVKQLIHWHLTYTWLIKSVDVEPALGLVCNCNSALHRKCLKGTCSCIGHPNLREGLGEHIPRLTKRFCRDDDVRPPDRYYVLMEVRNRLLLAFYMMKAQRHKMQYHRGCHVYLVEANRRRH
jgi:hypothetical protein